MSKEEGAFIEEAVENIRTDRATTKSLLMDAMIYLKKNEENHKSVGLIVAKYLETLQRSNEQLVKIAHMVNKNQAAETKFTDHDREEIFDSINVKEE